MRRLALSFLFLFFFAPAASAADLHFPALTGRVVDIAHVLSQSVRESLRQELEDYERGTGNQVVVVTLVSLEGDSIEDFGYKLLRAWGIGQKGKNNGALFIIVPGDAPGHDQVRIEAGYGLEGTLTDAATAQIINGIVIPAFKSGDMAGGVIEGTHAILSVLGGQSIHVMHNQQQGGSGVSIFHALLIILLLVLFIRNPSFFMWILLDDALRSGGGSIRGSGWGGGGGDNFRGGGGSAGGGGASGSW